MAGALTGMTMRTTILRALLRLLDPVEREVVEGDFLELGVPRVRAIGEVMGLLARRQAAVWLDWRPWIVLAAIVAPFASSITCA